MEQGIAFATGISVLLLSISCLIHSEAWIEWCRRYLAGGKPAAIILGAVTLGICALIVGLHWVWSGLPMLVTIVGIIGMAEATLYLLVPAALPRIWAPFLSSPKWFRLFGAGGAVLGLLILVAWAGHY